MTVEATQTKNWNEAGRRAFRRWHREWRAGGFSILDKSVGAQTRAVDWWRARREDFDERAFRLGWDEAEDAATGDEG